LVTANSFPEKKHLRPKLTLFVQLENGLAVDATLTPETRAYLEQLAARQGRKLSTSTASTSINDSLQDNDQHGSKAQEVE
jgi:E3 ubiquitin-protein ligase BAH